LGALWRGLLAWEVRRPLVQRLGAPLHLPPLHLRGPAVVVWEVVVACITPRGRPSPHRLAGAGCTEGVAVYRGADRRALSQYLASPNGKRNRHGLNKGLMKGHRVKVSQDDLNIHAMVTEAVKLLHLQLFFKLFFKTSVNFKGLRIVPAPESEVKSALAQKEKTPRIGTIFPQLEGSNIHDPFNLGFSYSLASEDLTTVRLGFTVTRLEVFGVLFDGKVTRDVVQGGLVKDTAPRILDMSERECPVEGGRTTRVRVSREDVQVEFYDKSCSWSAVVAVQKKPKTSSGLSSLFSFGRSPVVEVVDVEVPEFPTEVTSRHEVLIRLVPGEGESPGPPVPFYYTPRTSKVEEKVEQVEEDYIALLKKATENIPTQPIKASREVVNENVSQAEDEEAHKRARQKEMVERFFK